MSGKKFITQALLSEMCEALETSVNDLSAAVYALRKAGLNGLAEAMALNLIEVRKTLANAKAGGANG